MQPSNTRGRTLRFAMLPISWLIAVLVVYYVFFLVSLITSTTIRELFQTTSYWPLVLFIPALFFGKALGLMTLNLVAYAIPPIRRIFNSEVKETGRHSFKKAMRDLSWITLATGGVTVLCAILYIWNRLSR